MQTKLLKSKMVLHGDTLKKLSEEMGLTVRALCYKVNGKCQFKADEIKIIKDRYGLSDSDVAEIFLQ